MDEVVIPSKSKTQKIIFLFHGYGADKNDLLRIGEHFSQTLEEAEVHLPNGVLSCDEGPGRQWFPFPNENVEDWNKCFAQNASVIEEYIDEEVAKSGLQYKDTIIAGFSQGAMLALHFGIKKNVLGVVAFAGLLLDPSVVLQENEISTNILLAHGTLDNVIPVSAMSATYEALQSQHIKVTKILSESLMHGIDRYLLDQSLEFIKKL